MGNEQSKKNPNIEIELNHSRINLVKVINDPKKRFMQTTFAVQKNDYEAWKSALEKSRLHKAHLLIPFQQKFESKEFCGNSGSALVSYDNYPYLLLEEIENRRAKKKRFDETELWLLLYCLLDAQKQMKMGNLSRIGDVRPQNIFFNEQGLMKVANLLSWPKQASNFQKFLENQPTYLAPEDMPLIQASNIDNSENTQSQIFSIGLTILSAANLTDYKYLYSTSARKFDLGQFGKIVDEWRVNDYYSDIFKATLCSLIEVDKQHRITEEFLFPWIEKYREEILVRKDFVITDPPQLIINEVQMIRKFYENVASNYSGHQSHFNPNLGSELKRIGVPLEGSRRLVQEIRHPPIQVLPSSAIGESVYRPTEQSSYMSKFLVQGAPIGSTIPSYIDRTSMPSVENPHLVESLYAKNWSSQGKNVPKTTFEYSSSPERKVEEGHHQQVSQEEAHYEEAHQAPQAHQE